MRINQAVGGGGWCPRGRAGRLFPVGAAAVDLIGGLNLVVAVVGACSLAGSWACCPLALDRWLPSPSLPGLSLVSGGAPGIDTAAAAWAALRGVPCRVVRAQWGLAGRAAGPARNVVVAAAADAAVVVLDCRPGAPVSRGTIDVWARLCRAGVPCRVVRVVG